LGEEAEFSLEWVSIYTFSCLRMDKFVHGRVIFAGDSAHGVSPFGARGANSGIQDAENIAWKLACLLKNQAPSSLLHSYDVERGKAADENILNSTRSTDFLTPKSKISRVFRDATLELARNHAFARRLVNSGRLSVATHYQPTLSHPLIGQPAPDAPFENGYLLENLGGEFMLLGYELSAKTAFKTLNITQAQDPLSLIKSRYQFESGVCYLLRPDQYICARFESYDEKHVLAALKAAKGEAHA
jgi:3-(3-hydroxy-phenyl)propionate hydroxylase